MSHPQTTCRYIGPFAVAIEDDLVPVERFDFNDIPNGPVPDRVKDIGPRAPRPRPVINASPGHLFDSQGISQDSPESGRFDRTRAGSHPRTGRRGGRGRFLSAPP